DPDADRAAPRTGLGSTAQVSTPGSRARGTEESRQPAAASNRSRGSRPRKERPRRTRTAGSSVRCSQVERAAGVVLARRGGPTGAVLLGRSPGGDVALG